MIKLIIFDLWQTLAYRRGDNGPRSIRTMLNKFNLGISIEKAIKIFEDSVQTKKWKSKFKAYQNLCENLKINAEEQNVRELMNIRDSAEEKLRLYSFTIPLLKKLRKQGYKIGLISNSSEFAIKKVKEKTDLLKYVDYPLFSYNVGVIKPSQEFFKTMLKTSKLKANECVMIGDKVLDDVIPPKKLGMYSIHFKGYADLKNHLLKLGIDLK
ncbi:MAG: HAD family hydrolase [Nanoarchaeota archaeon]